MTLAGCGKNLASRDSESPATSGACPVDSSRLCQTEKHSTVVSTFREFSKRGNCPSDRNALLLQADE